MPLHKTLILLVGKSGSGKTTIAENAEKLYGLKSVQSYTTRPKRVQDETGHIFVSEAAFRKLKDRVAYTKFDNHEYCATASQVEEDDIYVIDPAGVETFRSLYKGDKKWVVVYIVSSSDPHEAFNMNYERMKERGNTIEEAAARVVLDNREFKDFESKADYVFVNKEPEDLDRIAEKLNIIVQKGGLDE